MIIENVPRKPRFPTAKPKRRNMIAPKIVEIAVKNTAAVDSPFLGFRNFLSMSIEYTKNLMTRYLRIKKY